MPLYRARELFVKAVREGVIWPYQRDAKKRRAAISRIQQIGEPRCEAVGEGWGDGVVCVITPTRRLTLDHVSGNVSCWHKTRFLCDPHQHVAHQIRMERGDGWGALTCGVCVSLQSSFQTHSYLRSATQYDGFDATADIDERVDKSQGSTETKLSGLYQGDVRKLIKQLIIEQGAIYRKKEGVHDAVFHVAEKVGCHPATIERAYLPKMLSPGGELRPLKSIHGERWVTAKREAWDRWRLEDPSLPSEPPYDKSEFLRPFTTGGRIRGKQISEPSL